MNNHDRTADYYDIIQEAICDYEAESRELHRVFQEHNVKNLIDVCCGTGTHLFHLSRLGYNCTGSDSSSEMLRIAGEKCRELPVRFLHSNILDLEMERAYDAVLCLYALSLIPVESVNAVIDKWHRLLKPGGLLVINAMNAEFMPGGKGEQAFMFNANQKGNLKVLRLNNMMRHGDIQDWQAVYLAEDNGKMSIHITDNKLHLYRAAELESALRRQGFQVKTVLGGLAGLKPLSPGSNDIVMIAARNPNG